MMKNRLVYCGKRENAYGDYIRFYKCPTLKELGLIHVCRNPFSKVFDEVSSHAGLSTFWYKWGMFLKLLKG